MSARSAYAIKAIHLCRKPGTAETKDIRGNTVTPSIPPVVDVIEPGARFEMTQEQFDELFALEAITESSDEAKLLTVASLQQRATGEAPRRRA